MQGDDKQEPADALIREIELEVAQKRAGWQRDRDKFRLIRLLSFSLLSLVILAALIAFFLLFSRVDEMRTQHPSATPVPSPQSSS